MGFFPLFSLQTWILLILFVCIFVLYGYWTYGVFRKLGIPGPKPLMYIGTIGRYNKVYYLDDVECAKRFGKLWGIFEFRQPIMMVTDPEMIKTILVKECFSYFTNRRDLRPNTDLYDSISLALDDHWRRIRNLMSPSFSSGHIKEMFSIMKHHSRKLTNILHPKALNNEVISVKDFFGGYSMDVIGSCTFSVDLNTVADPESPFISYASKLFNFSIPLMFLQGFFPFLVPLLELLQVSMFPKDTIRFFENVMGKIQGERSTSSNQNLRDFLQNFQNTQTGREEKHEKGLTDHEIFSQITMLMFAGYETSASTLVFLAYSLARNPEVLKCLHKEIDETFPNKGSVQQEALMHMDYLGSVIDECLRLYPPVARLERVTKKTVKINGTIIPKDVIAMVPVFALHRDPELWSEPEEFNPERFSKENKKNINPYTYLPFGIGPRNCLGMRFAQLMIRLTLVEILQNFTFSVCEETEIPLQMNPMGLVGPLNPIKLRLSLRSVDSVKEKKCN